MNKALISNGSTDTDNEAARRPRRSGRDAPLQRRRRAKSRSTETAPQERLARDRGRPAALLDTLDSRRESEPKAWQEAGACNYSAEVSKQCDHSSLAGGRTCECWA